MGTLDNPVIRAFFILAGGYLLAGLWIMITGYLPGSLQWFPLGSYLALGSLPYIATFLVGTFISGVLWWYVTFMLGRRTRTQLMANAKVAF